jgi:hypothetical protein
VTVPGPPVAGGRTAREIEGNMPMGWRSVVQRGCMASLAGLAATALILLPRPATSQPEAYSGAPIHGWVVDAETQQPLTGVHVVAQWILNTGMFLHAERIQRLHILETVTDAKGEYRIPGWGPKPRPPLSRLETADPRLTFFKPGYRPLDRSNNDPHDRPERTSRWDGKRIPLEPFRGTAEEWALALAGAQSAIAWGDQMNSVPPRVNDYWRGCPRIVLAIIQQRRLLPDRVRHLVQDLRTWEVSEQELQALVSGQGELK